MRGECGVRQGPVKRRRVPSPDSTIKSLAGPRIARSWCLRGDRGRSRRSYPRRKSTMWRSIQSRMARASLTRIAQDVRRALQQLPGRLAPKHIVARRARQQLGQARLPALELADAQRPLEAGDLFAARGFESGGVQFKSGTNGTVPLMRPCRSRGRSCAPATIYGPRSDRHRYGRHGFLGTPAPPRCRG